MKANLSLPSRWASLLILLLAGLFPTAALAAPRAGGAAGLDPAAYLDADGTLNVPEEFSGSFDLSGWDVRLHPSKGVVFSPSLATIGQWTSLGGAGTGLNGIVHDIEFNGGVLYAGGNFTDAGGDADADFIAQFSGGAWSSLGGAGTGLSGTVHDIEFNAGVLYAAGFFSDAGGNADADRIAQFSGGAWTTLGGVGTGLNNTVRDIEFNGGVLYAGGDFTDAGGDQDADGIAQFSGGAWTSLGGPGTGLNGIVFDIEFDGGVLYAGGGFTDAGGVTDADYIAKFYSGVWSSLGGPGTGLNSTVQDIEFNGGVLYAGGDFTDAGGDQDADLIAQFSSGAWSSLGGAGTGLNSAVYNIQFNGGVLYAGGVFTDAGGDADADHIAQFSGGAWSSLGGVGTGLNASVRDIEFNGDVLYAGGVFTDAGGDADADRIAQFGIAATVGGGTSGATSASASKEIASSGVTSLQFGRIIVSVPASAIPSGESDCKVVITQKGESGAYGFSLDDTVWDVKVLCGGHELSIFFDALSICIRPKDGVLTDKNVYHRHGSAGFQSIRGGSGPAGYVCGSTRLLSLFTLGELALPATGFAPGEVTLLGAQPQAYAPSDLVLSLPSLDQQLSIVGVPQGPNGWDVSWLSSAQAGYLYGTAFPTWAGNSALTAHVWNADNTAGPFYHLKELQYGDQFTISAYGSTYTYEVRSNRLVSENNLGLLNDSPYSLVTLITCESFNEATGVYRYRRAVQAVLVQVD